MRERMMVITMAKGWRLNGMGEGQLKVTESNCKNMTDFGDI